LPPGDAFAFEGLAGAGVGEAVGFEELGDLGGAQLGERQKQVFHAHVVMAPVFGFFVGDADGLLGLAGEEIIHLVHRISPG
jgi:hypothetical protein